MKKLLWLDDIRNPEENNWAGKYSPIEKPYEIIWVKSYDEFVNFIQKNALPDAICFDHDLGLTNGEETIKVKKDEYKTGYDCAKWLIEYCLDNNIRELPAWNIQSQNPVGKENISYLLYNYNRLIKQL